MTEPTFGILMPPEPRDPRKLVTVHEWPGDAPIMSLNEAAPMLAMVLGHDADTVAEIVAKAVMAQEIPTYCRSHGEDEWIAGGLRIDPLRSPELRALALARVRQEAPHLAHLPDDDERLTPELIAASFFLADDEGKLPPFTADASALSLDLVGVLLRDVAEWWRKSEGLKEIPQPLQRLVKTSAKAEGKALLNHAKMLLDAIVAEWGSVKQAPVCRNGKAHPVKAFLHEKLGQSLTFPQIEKAWSLLLKDHPHLKPRRT